MGQTTIYENPFVKFDDSEVHDGTMFSLIFEAAFTPERKNKIALIDPFLKRSLTFNELRTQILQLAEGLKRHLGLFNDNRNRSSQKPMVLAYSQNSIELVTLIFACYALSIPCTLANPNYTPEELAYQLSDTGASIFFSSSEGDSIERVFNAIKLSTSTNSLGQSRGEELELEKLKRNIWALPSIDGKVRRMGPGIIGEKIQDWKELLVGKEEVNENSWIRLEKGQAENELAFLLYSSGTTGKPKGVVLTHGNVNACVQQLNTAPDYIKSNDVFLNALPIFHIAGLNVALFSPLLAGATIIMMPRFEIKLYCECVEQYKATFIGGVPPIGLALVKTPSVKNYDFSSVRVFVSGAAPLGPEMETELANELGKTMNRTKPVPVTQMYGMTETAGGIATSPISLARVGTGFTGPLVPGLKGRLVKENGEDVEPIKPGEKETGPGELWLKGPCIVKGYHNNPSATKEAVTADGWLRTGDAVVIDKDGFIRIVDRIKEFIKYSGFQVAPAELETVLLSCDLVADAAVVGVWSKQRQTELPRAYVVLTPKGKTVKSVTTSIYDFVSARLAPYKRLRGGIFVVDSIPKSASGKILRKVIKEQIKTENQLEAKL